MNRSLGYKEVFSIYVLHSWKYDPKSPRQDKNFRDYSVNIILLIDVIQDISMHAKFPHIYRVDHTSSWKKKHPFIKLHFKSRDGDKTHTHLEPVKFVPFKTRMGGEHGF